MEINSLSIAELQRLIDNGEYILDRNKLYTREEWGAIIDAEKQEELYDLLQMTKKIQL